MRASLILDPLVAWSDQENSALHGKKNLSDPFIDGLGLNTFCKRKRDLSIYAKLSCLCKQLSFCLTTLMRDVSQTIDISLHCKCENPSLKEPARILQHNFLNVKPFTNDLLRFYCHAKVKPFGTVNRCLETFSLSRWERKLETYHCAM